MALNFPSSPNVGDQYTSGGVIWVWDGAKWTAGGISEAYLPLAGGTMIGPIMLPADPTANLQATTKQYVDVINPAGKYLPLGGGTITGALVVNSAAAVLGGLCSTLAGAPPLALQSPPTNDSSNAMPTTSWVNGLLNGRQNRNRLINGNFLNNQYNTGAAITPVNGQFLIDRWRCISLSQPNKFTSTIVNVEGAGIPSSYYLGIVSTSAYASLPADVFGIMQPVEYINIADFGWGAAGASPVTLSFWAAASAPGIYGGTIRNGAATRTYPFTFNLPNTNWNYITITIPGDTAGAWAVAATAIGLGVVFDLGSGANYLGPPGAWSSTNYTGAQGETSLVAISGAVLQLANVQLELGSQATPFDFRTTGDQFNLCRRYYQAVSGILCGGYSTASGAVYQAWPLSPPMRATPTITYSSISYGNASGLTTWSANLTMWGVYCTATAAGIGWCIFSATLSAEL